ncbi:enoyl-CoA hydratase/isomerase family protein [Xanthobacter sp. KR7-65]|uniref:enoyl-CoA hydratase/isomerase family protein n=1 Tax=Xanthobacter sp. KR7-65 TaxID=3156612 RepID=UPI0032B5D6B3
MSDTPLVRSARFDAVAVVTVDHPPVNALSKPVRAGLRDAIAAADADPGVAAIVLVCAGRTFIAGADIAEFDQPPAPPLLPDVTAMIAAAATPVIAALHGSALGGGFEVALAARYRVALASARVGLPETRLGLIPGAGGTQRLPRLVGVAPAAQMILSGAPVDAPRALAMGLIDRIVGDDLLAGAIAFSRLLPPPARREAGPLDGPALAEARAVLKALRAEHGGSTPEAIAGRSALDVMERGLAEGEAAGLAAERAAFLELRASPAARALREAFFAARRARS